MDRTNWPRLYSTYLPGRANAANAKPDIFNLVLTVDPDREFTKRLTSVRLELEHRVYNIKGVRSAVNIVVRPDIPSPHISSRYQRRLLRLEI